MPKKKQPGVDPMFEKKMEDKLIVMLTPEHNKRIEVAAKAAGKSKSTWARDILLEKAPEV